MQGHLSLPGTPDQSAIADPHTITVEIDSDTEKKASSPRHHRSPLAKPVSQTPGPTSPLSRFSDTNISAKAQREVLAMESQFRAARELHI